MEVKVSLSSEEVKTAIRNYVNTQGMGLAVKSVDFNDKGEAVAICEKAKPSSSINYMDR